MLAIFPESIQSYSTTPLEMIERKCAGHPDSLADMIANAFVANYIRYCWTTWPELRQAGIHPNLSADKIQLVGGTSHSKFGSFEMLSPIKAYLHGKITRNIGNVLIPIDKLFSDTVSEIFTGVFPGSKIIAHLEFEQWVVHQAGSDHRPGYYAPSSSEELIDTVRSDSNAADTVFCPAYAPLSVIERLSIYLEMVCNSPAFSSSFLPTGKDIKVLAKKRITSDGPMVEITMCLPILPELVSSRFEYDLVLKDVKKILLEEAHSFLSTADSSNWRIELKLNTKDTHERVYLAPFGTSLSKGDIGAVGRGTKSQGTINCLRASTAEAPAGKNINHFPGILLQLVATDIAHKIWRATNLENTVIISIDNGQPLQDMQIDILFVRQVGERERVAIKRITTEARESLPQYRSAYICACPIDSFRFGSWGHQAYTEYGLAASQFGSRRPRCHR